MLGASELTVVRRGSERVLNSEKENEEEKGSYKVQRKPF